MHLQPNIGSDRSWVWKVAADYSESPPTAETLAIRFANSTSMLIPRFEIQIITLTSVSHQMRASSK